MTGLGSAAHALSENCVGGPCDTHMHMPAGEHQADGSASGDHSDDVSHQSDGSVHEGCSPFLCHVLAITPQYSEATFDHSETVMGWQVGRLSTLQEPEHPDRPPNL